MSSDCKTIHDIKTRLYLECASSDFTHTYLISEDDTIYTDKCVTYVSSNKECILHGIRLQDYEVAGERILALVGK